MLRAPLRPRAPLVVTVHDLALLRHPDAFPRWHRATGTRALRAGVAATAPVPAAARIDPRLQRLRDSDRREILNQELRREQDTLERLRRSAGADPRDLARVQADVHALQHEIARLPPAAP